MKIIYLLPILLILSCSKEESKVDYVYENCCGIEALIADVGNGKLFVPNVFSPNGDGINDHFRVLADSNIVSVNSFIIKDKDGVVMFALEDYNPEYIHGNHKESWNGRGPTEEIIPGVFSYEVVVTSQNQITEAFDGEVCSWICDFGNTLEELKAPNNIFSECFWGIQHDGQGGFDGALGSGEIIVGECVTFE